MVQAWSRARDPKGPGAHRSESTLTRDMVCNNIKFHRARKPLKDRYESSPTAHHPIAQRPG
jgi:hypothetical protein